MKVLAPKFFARLKLRELMAHARQLATAPTTN